MYLFFVIVFSEDVYSDDFSGSAILISVQCKQMVSIVKLTTFMLQYELITIDCTNNSSFLQGLRCAVRIAGCDNKHCIVMISVSAFYRSILNYCLKHMCVMVTMELANDKGIVCEKTRKS